MKKPFKQIICATMMFIAVCVSVNNIPPPLTSVSAATVDPSKISVNLVKSKAVDVMLVSKHSDFTAGQVQAIEENVKNQLQGYDVQFAGLETTEQVTSTNTTDPSVVFNNWSRLGAAGRWSLTTYDGANVIYNAENSDGVTGFYAPDTGDISDMTLEYDFMSADGDDDFVGVVLRLNVDDDKYGTPKPLDTKASGYWYWETYKYNGNYHWQDISGLYRLNSAKLPFSDWGANHSGLRTLYSSGGSAFDHSDSWVNQSGLKALSVGTQYGWTKKNQWIHYKYEMKGNTFSVWRDGSLVLTYTDTDENAVTSGTFALINMSQSSRYKNFVSSVTRVSTKSMTDILRNATWRDEATHVVIDIDNMLDSTLTESGELTSRLIADNVYLQFWGSDTNNSSLISYGKDFGNDENNIPKYNFINQSAGYNSCITSTVDYIKRILSGYDGSTYGIINEITDINVSPAEAKNNSIDTSWPDGKWKIIHDNTKIVNDTLQNGLGLSNQANMYLDNLTCKFDRPGNYTIYYMDVPIKTVYIHRRPVADFTISLNSSSDKVAITDKSYDLDTNLGTKKNGIKSVTWKYKKATDQSWKSGYPSSWKKSDGVVIVQMTVTDYQDCSSSVAKYLGDDKPIAAFSFDLNPVSLYEDITVLNSSYDSTGNTINKSNWIIKDKSGNTVVTNNTNKVGDTFSFGTPNGLGLSEGDYTVYLTVTNSAGTSSDTVSRKLYISKVTSHAVYEYNWDNAHHDDCDKYANVFYKSTYPTLLSPAKAYRYTFDKTTGTQVDAEYKDASSTFNGWYLDEALTKMITSGTTVVTTNGNHTIYAKWTNNGSVTLPSAKKAYDISFNANDTELDRATLNTTKLTENWQFNGWYSDEKCTKLVGVANHVVNNVSSNQTLYAGWKDKQITLPSISRKYTLTYDANGGQSTASDTQPVTFNGWYSEKSGGTKLGNAGDKYTVNNNQTAYARWSTATFKLPDCKKTNYKFLGWYSKPQNSDNISDAVLIGKAGATVYAKNSQTLYAWFNANPVITNTGSVDFYEGQTVNVKDLLQFVTASDAESDNLDVKITKIEYCDKTTSDVSDDAKLVTSTAHIGDMKVTYSVTDTGISIGDNKISDSDTSNTFSFTFKIKCNDIPRLKVNPVAYADLSLDKSSITAFLKSYASVIDKQDDTDNKPWWNINTSQANLKSSVSISSVKDIQISPAYEIEHQSISKQIKSCTTLAALYGFKSSNPEAFKAITSYTVVFDAYDQFGKYSSGEVTTAAKNMGVVADKKQSVKDRSIMVICVNDYTEHNVFQNVRDINAKYLDSLNYNSYWGNSYYGLNSLQDILNKKR